MGKREGLEVAHQDASDRAVRLEKAQQLHCVYGDNLDWTWTGEIWLRAQGQVNNLSCTVFIIKIYINKLTYLITYWFGCINLAFKKNIYI